MTSFCVSVLSNRCDGVLTVEDITIADRKAVSQIDTFTNSDNVTDSQAVLTIDNKHVQTWLLCQPHNPSRP